MNDLRLSTRASTENTCSFQYHSARLLRSRGRYALHGRDRRMRDALLMDASDRYDDATVTTTHKKHIMRRIYIAKIYCMMLCLYREKDEAYKYKEKQARAPARQRFK